MKATQRILSVITAVGLLALGVFSADMTRKMRHILADLGDVAVPLPSQFLLSLPTWFFVCFGAACAAGTGLSIWRLRRAWLSIPTFLLTAVIAFLYFGIFSASMLAPIGGLIWEIHETKTTQGEQPARAVTQEPAQSAAP